MSSGPPVDEDDERDVGGVGLGRTLALSDGIFAISMTLLAFQIQPPVLSGKDHDLTAKLLAKADVYYVYFLSFAVIGLLWMVHHRLFRHIDRADEVLMYLNLLFLMLVAAIPFPTAVLGRYGGYTASVVLYAAVMTATATLLTVLTVVAQRRHLVSALAPGDGIRQGMWRGATFALVFAVSIPFAFVDPNRAPLIWLVTVFMRFVPSDARRRARAAAKEATRDRPPAETSPVSPPPAAGGSGPTSSGPTSSGPTSSGPTSSGPTSSGLPGGSGPPGG